MRDSLCYSLCDVLTLADEGVGGQRGSSSLWPEFCPGTGGESWRGQSSKGDGEGGGDGCGSQEYTDTEQQTCCYRSQD